MSKKMVKSASRIFEILELFEKERRPLPAIEISDILNYPLASTHELLKTMVALGYFTVGTPRRAYMPSSKLPGVVDWINDELREDKRLQEFLAALSEATGETINLSRPQSTKVKIVSGIECTHPLGVSSKPGTTMPVACSLTGIASLAILSDDELQDYLGNLRHQDREQYKNIDANLIHTVISEIRQSGVALRCDLMVEGIGAVCLPVLSGHSGECLVVGVVGPSDRLSKNAYAHKKAIRRLVKEFNIKTVFPVKVKRNS